MKKLQFVSLSLTASPRRVVSPEASPLRGDRSPSSKKVSKFLHDCASLQLDVSSSSRALEGHFANSLSALHRVKKVINTVPPADWKYSESYQNLRERMQFIEKEQEATNINHQIELLRQQTGINERKKVKLFVPKTQIAKGKKAKTVQEQVFFPTTMLSSFAAARQLGQSQRAFGTLSHRYDGDDMDDFLKSEIVRYERERKDRLLRASNSLSPRSDTDRLDREAAMAVRVRETSPLLIYMQKHHNRRPLGQVAAEQRRLLMEEKMAAIQPSKEVQALARKFLPKAITCRKRKVAACSFTPRPRPHKRQPDLSLDSSFSDSRDEYIAKEVKRELTNLTSQLRIAALVNERNRADFIKKAK